MLLDEYDVVPYQVLNILVSDINYGGRVTDDKDVRLIRNILRIFMTDKVMDDNYKYSESGIYYAPEFGSYSNFKSYIDNLPKILTLKYLVYMEMLKQLTLKIRQEICYKQYFLSNLNPGEVIVHQMILKN